MLGHLVLIVTVASPLLMEEHDGMLTLAREGGVPITAAAVRQARYLELSGFELTRGDLAVLASATSVETLELDNTEGMAGLEQLSLGKLKHLVLVQARGLTKQGLQRLARAPRLTKLTADGEMAAAMPSFAGSRLKEIDLVDPALDLPAFRVLGALPALESLYLESNGGASVTDEGLAALARSTSLERLRVEDRSPEPEITDAGLAALAPLKRLHSLELVGTRITHVPPRVLKGWPALRTLSFWGSELTDDALEQLAIARPELRRLRISFSRVTEAGLVRGLAHLPELEALSASDVSDQALAALGPRVRELELLSSTCTEAGLARLANLPLETLQLECTSLGDSAGATLSRLVTLRSLSLRCARCTDALLDRLVTLERLEALHLLGPFSDEKVQRLEARLPRLR